MGLDPIWSVAPNKLVAKVATRLVKPTGEYIVAAGEEQSFLSPLPLRLIPGVERNDLTRLSEFNFEKVFQVASLSLEQLRVVFGNRARFLYESMRGIDSSPVLPAGKGPPKVVRDREFGNDVNDVDKVEGALYALVEEAGGTLRRRRLTARSVAIAVDYSDGYRCIRQKKADPPTANDLTLFDIARQVLAMAWFRRTRIRHIRLICDRLIFPPAQQLDLFSPVREEQQRRIDLVRSHRRGQGTVRRRRPAGGKDHGGVSGAAVFGDRLLRGFVSTLRVGTFSGRSASCPNLVRRCICRKDILESLACYEPAFQNKRCDHCNFERSARFPM